MVVNKNDPKYYLI